MRRAALTSLLLAAAAAGTSSSAVLAAEPATVPGEVVIRFEGGVDAARRAELRRAENASVVRSLQLPGAQLVELEPGASVREVVSRLARRPEVAFAEPNYVYELSAMPNDDFLDDLWGLHNVGQSILGTSGTADADIDAPEAWDRTTGAGGPPIGVVDSGIDYTHDDLDANVDVQSGWDFWANDNNPQDANGHGTHVAGTIGAEGNNGDGVAGVNWTAKLVPLRACGASGACSSAAIADAFGYAGGNGIRLVNASLGGPHSNLVEAAVAASPATLFVVAAGNDGVDVDSPVEDAYPCELPASNVVCVAATDQSDQLADFSNYGDTAVDLAAPGVNVGSTYPRDDYIYLDGTSMATPHVTGIAALLLAAKPGAPVAELRSALLAGVDDKPGLAGSTATGGRANAAGALDALPPAEQAPPADTGAPAAQPAPSAGSPGPVVTAAPLALGSSIARRSLGSVLRSGLLVRIDSSRAGRATVELLLGSRVARRLGFASRSVRLARRSVGARAGRTMVRVRLPRRARMRLRRARRLALTVRITLVSGSERRATTARLTLRR